MKKVTCKKILQVQKEGSREVKNNMQKVHTANFDKPVKFYSLGLF